MSKRLARLGVAVFLSLVCGVGSGCATASTAERGVADEVTENQAFLDWLKSRPTPYPISNSRNEISMDEWMARGREIRDADTRLQSYLQHPTDEHLIASALLAMGHFGRSYSSKVLLRYLRNDDLIIRISAQGAALRVGATDLTWELCRMAVRDPDPSGRANACHSLAGMGRWDVMVEYDAHLFVSAEYPVRGGREWMRHFLLDCAVRDNDEMVRVGALQAASSL